MGNRGTDEGNDGNGGNQRGNDGNAENQGGNAGNAGNRGGNGGNWGWKWRDSGWESSYRSGIDELELWKGIKLRGNMCIYENVVLVWETIKETNLNTGYCFHKYYFILINQKENILHINVFHVIVKMSRNSHGGCVIQVFFRKGVLQKRSKLTGDHACRSVISIELHSKNLLINLHFWECRLF